MMWYSIAETQYWLLLQLQSRFGARSGEVLKIRVKNIDGRKIHIQDPKSGREAEVIFMHEPVANRLKAYIQKGGLEEGDRVFNICYSTARKIVNRLGEKVGIKLNPPRFEKTLGHLRQPKRRSP